MFRIFNKFGFTVRELSDKDKEPLYVVLKQEYLYSKKHYSMLNKDLRVLSGEIDFTFSKENYYAIGIFKSKKLIGACLCNNKDNVPWIGKMSVLREYRKTKAFMVMAHYILNIVFKEQAVRMNTPDLRDFKSMVSLLPLSVGGQFVKKTSAERLQSIMDRTK